MPAKAICGDHALVIGGSIAGLLAARVLADHFLKVTIIDRDKLGPNDCSRRGVPQGHHGHALLLSGARIFEELFPGWNSEVEERGAVPVDFAQSFRFFHFGVWKARYQSSLKGFLQSRPFVESHLLLRVLKIKNINVRDKVEATGFSADANRGRIIGVKVRDLNGPGTPDEILSDLVVDAGGQSSRASEWLEEFGYSGPEVTKIAINLGYATRLYRPSRNPNDWRVLAIYPRPPFGRRLGSIFNIEKGLWQVTLAGYLGDHPPSDDKGFLDFARSLAQPDIYKALIDAEPVSDIWRFRFPYSIWRRYDRLARFPDGLINIGDAVCRLDPSYAHGMSIAAKGASTLSACLSGSDGGAIACGFSRRFHRCLARSIAQPWLITTSEAYRFPTIPGRRRAIHRLMQWFAGNIYEISENDKKIHAVSSEVMHLAKPTRALLRPFVLGRVLYHNCPSLRQKIRHARLTITEFRSSERDSRSEPD